MRDDSTIFQNYEKLHKQLRKGLYIIKSELGNSKDKKHSKYIDTIEMLLEELNSDVFIVSVIGELKKGKSTLLNALIGSGKEICPTDVIESTAAISVIRKGKESHAVIEHENGKNEKVSVKRLLDYVTKEGKHNSPSLIANIFVEDTLLEDKVVLVDTPGVNSPNSEREAITFNWLNKSDAVIFMATCEELITNSEREFLYQKVHHDCGIHSIFVVINKVDEPENDETKEQIYYTATMVKKIIKEITGIEAKNIIPVSARLAWEGICANDSQKYRVSNFDFLRTSLKRFLIREKGKSRLLKRSYVFQNLVLRSLLNELDLEHQLNLKSLEELDRLVTKLNASNTELNNRSLLRKKMVDERRRSLYAQIERMINKIKNEENEKFFQLMSNNPDSRQMKIHEANLNSTLKKLCFSVRETSVSEFKTKSADIINSQVASVQKYYDELSNGLKPVQHEQLNFDSAMIKHTQSVGFFKSLWNAIKSFFVGEEKKINYHIQQVMDLLNKSFMKIKQQEEDNIRSMFEKLERILVADEQRVMLEVSEQIRQAVSMRNQKHDILSPRIQRAEALKKVIAEQIRNTDELIMRVKSL